MDFAKRKVYYNRCDPLEFLPAGDDRYEAFDEKKLRGTEEAARRLLTNIELSNGPTAQLFSGLLGSGKSTELRRLVEMAEKAGYCVACTDVINRPIPFVDRSKPLQPADVLYAVCLTLDDALGGKSGKKYPFHDALPRLWKTLSASLEIDELTIGLPQAEVKARLASEPSFREKLNSRLEASPLKFKEGIDSFVRDANESVRQSGYEKGLLVVLDGLEKVAESEIKREEKEAAFRDVFLSRPDLMRVSCHVVYCISPFMIWHSSELGDYYDSDPIVLPMVRVRKFKSQDRDSEGISSMCDALNRRIPIADAFSGKDVVENLVLNSGGFMRDLLRFVREAIARCPEDCLTITDDIASGAIRRVQRSYREGLLEEYRKPLREAHSTWAFPFSMLTQQIFGRLLRGHMLLRYHNEHEWYDAHPLLWDLLGRDP